jgi:osmotically-inducible protein OsmY
MSTTATEYAAVSKYRFGAPVLTDEGEEGTLDSLIVDPATRAITGFRVRFGLFSPEKLALPITIIRHASPGRIELHASRDDLRHDQTKMVSAILLNQGTQVVAGGKPAGKLVQVTVNRETQVLRHFVVARGLGAEWLVSAGGNTVIEGKRITVKSASDATTPSLTPYRPDEEIHEDVRAAIYDYPRLRVDLPGIGIRVIDGVLWLQGHVSSDLNKRLVQDQLVNIRGLSELHNDLIADTDLAATVAMALATDARTARERIGVYPSLGNISLRGRVHSELARAAAYDIVRGVPGVRDVDNALIIDPNAEVIPVLAGVTNEEDRVPGGN